jgi:protein tyrosine phosphatase
MCKQMVWEQGSTVIVNLTCLVEDTVSLCQRYWPETGSDLHHIYEVSRSAKAKVLQIKLCLLVDG